MSDGRAELEQKIVAPTLGDDCIEAVAGIVLVFRSYEMKSFMGIHEYLFTREFRPFHR